MRWRVLPLIVSALLVSSGGASLRAAGNHRIAAARELQKGKPFTLTLAGRNLGEGREKIHSTMPASFAAGDFRSARDDAGRVRRPPRVAMRHSWSSRPRTLPLACTRSGSSRARAFQMLAFTVGAFPEFTEDKIATRRAAQHERQCGDVPAASVAAVYAEWHLAWTRGATCFRLRRQGRRKASDRSGSAALRLGAQSAARDTRCQRQGNGAQ